MRNIRRLRLTRESLLHIISGRPGRIILPSASNCKMPLKNKDSKSSSARPTRLKDYVKFLHSDSCHDKVEPVKELIPRLQAVAPPFYTYHPFVKHPDYKGTCGLDDIKFIWLNLAKQPYDDDYTKSLVALQEKSYSLTSWRPWDPVLKALVACKWMKGDYS